MCPPDSKIKYSVFYVYSCSCINIIFVILLVSFMQSYGKFMFLFIKDIKILYSLFCILWCTPNMRRDGSSFQ